MPKTKKKSKKQLEDELQKAAEEQKRHEEKERLFKLEEDALAANRERLEIELEGKNRVLEAERLEEEQELVVRMKGERKRCLDYEQSKLQEKIEWQKFVSCTSRPNVMFENEITTYVSMVREERSDRESMETAIEKCKAAEEVVGDLLELYCKACEEGNVTRQDWCMHYIGEIRALEVELIDAATAHLLLYIEKQEANAHLQVYLQWGNANDEMKVGFWGHLQSKGFRAKSIEHSKIQIGLDLPKAIQLQSIGHCIGVRSLYTTFDSAGKDPVQMSIGGMIRVDLLSIPPFSKKVKGWTIRQVPAPGKELMKLPYPNTEHTTASTAIAAPCKIDYKVPSHVLVSKSPVVSWWDASVERWSTEGINEITWEQETRKISFFTARLASFSITQERHIDLPYKHWNMRPCDDMVVELTVQAARYELRFMISEDGLRLKGPQLPELLDVMFEPGSGEAGGLSGPSGRRPRIRSPATLLNELRDCGLNLMPKNSDADQLEGYTPKHPETQARAYSDLSEIAAFYDIASSRHNKDLPAERALVRIRENELREVFNPLDSDGDADYQAIMFFPKKCCQVQSLEGVSPCREAMAPGHFTHASLYLCFDKDPAPGPNHAERLQRLEVTIDERQLYPPNGSVPYSAKPLVESMAIPDLLKTDISIFSCTSWLLREIGNGEANSFFSLVMFGFCVIVLTTADVLFLFLAAKRLFQKQDTPLRDQGPCPFYRWAKIVRKLSMLDVSIMGVYVITFCMGIYKKQGIVVSTREGLVVLILAEVAHSLLYCLVSGAVEAQQEQAERAQYEYKMAAVEDGSPVDGSPMKRALDIACCNFQRFLGARAAALPSPVAGGG